MSLVAANVGELLLLEWALKSTSAPENLTLKLFKNDYTPVAGSVAGNFTEANFTDYVAKTLSRASWGAPAIVGGKAETQYAQQSWTCGTTGNDIYGYYIVGATSGTLIWAERFAAMRPLAENDVLNLVPLLTLNSEA